MPDYCKAAPFPTCPIHQPTPPIPVNRLPGACPITLEYTGSDAKAMLQFGEQWAIDPADGLIQALRDQFGRENVFLQYR